MQARKQRSNGLNANQQSLRQIRGQSTAALPSRSGTATVKSDADFPIDLDHSQLGDLVGLKKDGQRVSLEGVLTGAALGLVVLFLQNDTAEASQAPGRWPGGEDGWGSGPDGGGDRTNAPTGFRPRETWTRRHPARDDPQPDQSGDAGVNLLTHGYSHGAFPLQEQYLPSNIRLRDLEIDPVSSRPSAASEEIEARSPSNGEQDPQARAVNKDPVPTLIIRVSNQEEINSRSLDGGAIVNRSGNQFGLANGRLDLSESTIPNLLIQSDQGFHGLALSISNDAELSHQSSNAALLNALVIKGPETGSTWIQANQLLALAAHSTRKLQVQVDENLAAMEGSRLDDLGGDDRVELGAHQQLNFSDGGLAQEENISIAMDSYGMVHSAMALGPGNNWIQINSAMGPWQLGLEGLLGLLSRNQDWGLRLQARAFAMDHSLLDSGAGNDQVWIKASLDPSIRAQLEPFTTNPRAQFGLQQIAALASYVSLGTGDDVLRLSGEVQDSTIDLGTGSNLLQFDDGARQTAIVMGDGSSNQILLADQPNAIDLHGGERLNLWGGSAADQIYLSKGATTGLLDGAAGHDLISTAGNPNGSGSELTLDGANHGTLNGLSIRNIESIQLGAGDDRVRVTPGGFLTGQLAGGAGMDSLDFSSNKTPVAVSLDHGSIREPGKPSMGTIEGFERVLGGGGDDQFFLGRLFSSAPESTPMQIRGGPGIDQFIWDSLSPTWPHGLDRANGLPSLVDLQVITKADGGIGLSDQIGWATLNQGASSQTWGPAQLLTPSSLSGLGDSQLLPIAPMDQLLAGQASLGAKAVSQLAIGTTATGAELLALGPEGENGVIAHLPGLFSGYYGSIP